MTENTDFYNPNQPKVTTDIYSEMPNQLEKFILKGYKIITEVMKNYSNYSDVITKLEDFSKKDVNSYNLIIAGFIYGTLFSTKSSNDFFQYLLVINKDNFDFYLSTIIQLLEFSHLKLLPETYYQIFYAYDKLIHMNSPKLVELLIMLCRVFFIGKWLYNKIEIYQAFLRFILSKLNWITQNTNQFLVGVVFIKILHLLKENHFILESTDKKEIYQEVITNQTQIIDKLWKNKPDAIIFIGKELLRSLIPLAKAGIPEIDNILTQLASSSVGNVPLYQSILTAPGHFNGLNPFVHILIPPLMEKMVTFILTEVKRQNYSKYLSWIISKFEITGEKEFSILTDIARFITTCYSFFIHRRNDITPRWLFLGNILKNCRNELHSSELKQAIFFDWLFFNKERDNFLLVESGIAIILNSVKDFPNMTMELIEYLDSYSENFDLRMRDEIRRNISDAFKQAESYGMCNHSKFLKEEKISDYIKKVYEGLIQVKEEDMSMSMVLDLDTSIDKEPEIIKETPQFLISDERKVKINCEFFILRELDELITPIALKNFLNYKTRPVFKSFLEELIKNYISKTKHNDEFLSKIGMNKDVFSAFALFYLNLFKDELIVLFPSKDNKEEGVSLFLIDHLILKSSKPTDKEYLFLINVFKSIVNKYPQFIVKLILIFSKKCEVNKHQLFIEKNLYSIFHKICEEKPLVMREKIIYFIDTCIDLLEIESLNIFFEHGLTIFSKAFVDDFELINLLVLYTNTKSYNQILQNINMNKFNLIEKELYKILNSSLDWEQTEIDKLWDLVSAHTNIQINFKSFISSQIALCKNYLLKHKQGNTEFFKNIIKFIKIAFLHEIDSKTFGEFYEILNIPVNFSEGIYNLLKIIHEHLVSQNIKDFSNLFFNLIDEYILNIKSSKDKIFSINNFMKVIEALIKLDRNDSFPILLDQYKYTLVNLKSKLKDFGHIQIE